MFRQNYLKLFNKIKNLAGSGGGENGMAFVIDWKFHQSNKWVSALTPYLVEAIVKEFKPIIISSQKEYDRNKHKIDKIISMEPGWAAPKLKYDTKLNQKIGIFLSDPHSKTDWLVDYVNSNNITHVLSYYHSPFFYHFPEFPQSKFVHVPWSIPDQFVSNIEPSYRNSEVAIFGGKGSDAYDVRNWCREQKEVTNYTNSGVENKKMTDEEYFRWLSDFDAIVAAGSSYPIYEMVTPKYFEIASAGALLFGQYCKDLSLLGFNDTNAVIFTKDTFIKKVNMYKEDPKSYIDIRKKGLQLIKERHKLSDRIDLLRQIFS